MQQHHGLSSPPNHILDVQTAQGHFFARACVRAFGCAGSRVSAKHSLPCCPQIYAVILALLFHFYFVQQELPLIVCSATVRIKRARCWCTCEERHARDGCKGRPRKRVSGWRASVGVESVESVAWVQAGSLEWLHIDQRIHRRAQRTDGACSCTCMRGRICARARLRHLAAMPMCNVVQQCPLSMGLVLFLFLFSCFFFLFVLADFGCLAFAGVVGFIPYEC